MHLRTAKGVEKKGTRHRGKTCGTSCPDLTRVHRGRGGGATNLKEDGDP